MNTKTWMLGLAALVTALAGSMTTAACTAPEEDVGSGASRVSTRERFDKDDLLADRDFATPDAMTRERVQRFLERTPYGTRSVLASFRDPQTDQTAAAIIVEAATRHDLNPLLLLVRLQMEQGLVRASTIAEEDVATVEGDAGLATGDPLVVAFGCGCPDTAVCSEQYLGFANQAECAAGTLRRSFDRATTPAGTASGWARGRAKRTEDGITVTPRNAATAALYTYTPWVGQAGGGRSGIGGASLHWQTWSRFAEAVGYRARTSAQTETETETETNDDDTPLPLPPPPPPPPPPLDHDAGAATEVPFPPPGEDDDAALLGTSSGAPATNSPPPPRSGSSSSASGSGGAGEGDEEEDRTDLPEKKAASQGCATSGGPVGGGSGVAALGLALGAILARRRQCVIRRSASQSFRRSEERNGTR